MQEGKTRHGLPWRVFCALRARVGNMEDLRKIALIKQAVSGREDDAEDGALERRRQRKE